MSMLILRVTVQDIDDVEAMELKHAIEELLEDIEDARLDVTLMPTRSPRPAP